MPSLVAAAAVAVPIHRYRQKRFNRNDIDNGNEKNDGERWESKLISLRQKNKTIKPAVSSTKLNIIVWNLPNICAWIWIINDKEKSKFNQRIEHMEESARSRTIPQLWEQNESVVRPYVRTYVLYVELMNISHYIGTIDDFSLVALAQQWKIVSNERWNANSFIYIFYAVTFRLGTEHAKNVRFGNKPMPLPK